MCFQISSYGFVPPPQLVKVEKGTIPELYTPFELDGTRHWGKGATRYATPLWVFCGESQYTVKNFLHFRLPLQQKIARQCPHLSLQDPAISAATIAG